MKQSDMGGLPECDLTGEPMEAVCCSEDPVSVCEEDGM